MENELLREDDEEVPLGEQLSNTVISLSLVREESFPVNPVSKEFYSKFYPGTDEKDWNSWRWQLSNSITNSEQLQKIISLSDDEKKAMDKQSINLPLRITPYYASLLSADHPLQGIRRSVVPLINETFSGFGEEEDPLHEDSTSPAPGIVHRYPDRVLFLATGFCAAYCRYCTRCRMVGNSNESFRFSTKVWEKAIKYIEENTQIRDVLISGGDPLTMPDNKIEYLLSRLRKIEHVEIIRIGTKVPAVMPQRITPKLIRMLKKYHPLFISIHFTHPDEITQEVKAACTRLADAGIPLGSQTVLLKGINNNPDVMKDLFHRLLKVRVRPYYLYQCDPVKGSAHFRTSVEEGLNIIKSLRGFTSGYAVPHYVIDAPGGGGKIPVLPEYYQYKDENYTWLKNYEGLLYKYPDHS
jgi:lysine 2,3-aminomutase